MDFLTRFLSLSVQTITCRNKTLVHFCHIDEWFSIFLFRLLMFTALVFPSRTVIQLNLGSVALHESSDKIKKRGVVSTDFLLKPANQNWN